MNSIRKVVLAYSGGLDTSVILKWIKETYIGTPSLIKISTTDFEVNKKQMIIDYISGMTDRYILKIYSKI